MEFITGPVEIIGCHAQGEVGDVVVSGVDTPPGSTVWEQSRWVLSDGRLRQFLLNEPRGGVFRHLNLIVPAVHPDAAFGFIIMEPEDNPAMSGSNAMCVATVALETGIVAMTEPVSQVTMEAPGGLITATAMCNNGKVTSVTIENLPSFAASTGLQLELAGTGSLMVDTAWGGDSFVMVNANDLGLELRPENGRELAQLGSQITRAANEQLIFAHPTLDWTHFSFCQIAGPLIERPDGLEMSNTVVVEPGKLDRSPTGTGVSARMAVLYSQGTMQVGDSLTMRSIIGSEFIGRIAATTTVGGVDAIVPEITGSAWRTGTTVHEFDPSDPWPLGYRVADTWPARR